MNQLETYQYPAGCPQNTAISVFVNGEKQTIYQTPSTDIVAFSFTGQVTITIVYDCAVDKVAIRPYSRNIPFTHKGEQVEFSLSHPTSLLVDVNGRNQLHIHANELKEKPDPNAPGMHYYQGGQTYDVGELHLREGETLYIEGGAVLQGTLRAQSAPNIHVCGYGIFDGGWTGSGRQDRLFIFDTCDNLLVEDIIMIRPKLWMLTLLECKHVHILRLKQVGEVISSDGVDVVSSQHVRIEKCFLRNNDDCIVMKSMPFHRGDDHQCSDTCYVEAIDCTLLNESAGNAMEIGHELRCNRVHDILFDNCDIVSVHGVGAAFSIHNADHAVVEDVLFRNIRVEHYYEKLLDFKVIQSMWGKTPQRGHIRNIKLENIYVTNSIYNPGYSVSMIGGWDSEHKVTDVTIENLYLNDQKVTNANQLDLFTKEVENIRFQ